MQRLYQKIIEEHFASHDQMILLSGPRQVGKTTIAKNIMKRAKYHKYLNWDNAFDREQILAGNNTITSNLPIDAILDVRPNIVLDEIHKYSHWKNFLKGFIDEYKGRLDIIVTGSAKLDVYRKGGDSLMGRYFLYRVHPISVAELVKSEILGSAISSPKKIEDDLIKSLLEFGGFPEPFLKQEKKFYNRWQNLRQQQMLKEDIRDLAKIQELAQLEVLANIIKYQAGQLLNYTSLAKKVRVSDQTIRRWINVLESFFYCFTIRPWSKNISRSLIKEPKLYLCDWSIIEDAGARLENFVACHFKKAIDFWNDYGFGNYGLFFLRDKDKREVDFLITDNDKPWALIEVKTSANQPISNNLLHFQEQIKAQYCLQLAFDLPYVEYDFREIKSPKVFPMSTFLSQLI